MLNTVGIKSRPLNKDLVLPIVNLRAFRNKFLKYYAQSENELSAEDLSALLLYFALSFIGKKNCLAKLFKVFVPANQKLEDLDEDNLFSLGSAFIDLLEGFLPETLAKVMSTPNKVSWRKARCFFVEYNIEALCSDIANLGFAYQIFGSFARREKALPALQKANKKISKEELIAFTQLYTPTWVVDFLIANTVLSGYKHHKISERYSKWLIPEHNEIRELAQIELSNFSLIDPACGAGQFLFSAFDLLTELYEKEGYQSGTAAKLILSKNIFAADIDQQALWVAALGLLCKYLIVCTAIEDMPERLNNLAFVSTADVGAEVNEGSFLGSIDNRLHR